MQLRSAIDALRTAAGLGSYNFTDTLTAGLTSHINDLRGGVQ